MVKKWLARQDDDRRIDVQDLYATWQFNKRDRPVAMAANDESRLSVFYDRAQFAQAATTAVLGGVWPLMHQRDISRLEQNAIQVGNKLIMSTTEVLSGISDDTADPRESNSR